MISKIIWNNGKLGTRPQNKQYTYPTVRVYENPVATKKFLTESILKTIDSSVRNPGEVEYDKQNRLKFGRIIHDSD